MVATLQGFPFHWQMGEDKLTIVSVGTGYSIFSRKTDEIEVAWLGTWASNVPDMLMQDASWQNQIVLQWLSKSPTACTIDTEIGNLDGNYLGDNPLINCRRYNFPITKDDLNGLGLGRTFDEQEVANTIEMSNAGNRELLYQIGSAATDKVEKNHFN